ncbi:MAG: hypothetical protein NT030_05015 [Candidatus Saganbacteria bacterium]|nr:hypothetical protein [Candidatus Saganbacteria bacterium]
MAKKHVKSANEGIRSGIEALKNGNKFIRLNLGVTVLETYSLENIQSNLKIKLIDPLIAARNKEKDNLVRYGIVSVIRNLSKSSLPLNQKIKLIDPLIVSLRDENLMIRKLAVEALRSLVKLNIPYGLKSIIDTEIKRWAV